MIINDFWEWFKASVWPKNLEIFSIEVKKTILFKVGFIPCEVKLDWTSKKNWENSKKKKLEIPVWVDGHLVALCNFNLNILWMSAITKNQKSD